MLNNKEICEMCRSILDKPEQTKVYRNLYAFVEL